MNQNYNEINCPICGMNIELIENAKYCSHIAYIYGWSTDSDFWIYIENNYVLGYINYLKSAELNDYFTGPTPSDDQLALFSQGRFSPGDELSKSVPYINSYEQSNGKTVKTSCFEIGYYSGIYMGIFTD